MTITLATLAQANPQEIFDQVAVHLLTQNEKSMLGGACVYRGQTRKGKKLMCAAGCLISDEEVKALSKTQLASSWLSLICDSIAPIEYELLIRQFQIIHDNCPVMEWKLHLLKVATQWDFKIDAIKDLP